MHATARRAVRRVGYVRRMGWRRAASASGQTQAEYALLAAGIAAACIFAVLFLGGSVDDLWSRSAKPVTPHTFSPPFHSVLPPEPSSASDCENGGWQSYPQFPDEDACLAFLAGPPP